MRTLEILHGPDSHIPEARIRFSNVYSRVHEKLLLRVDHVERMDAIRKEFNERRLHAGQRLLTTSDIVNACLDFVFEHPIPFENLHDADRVLELLRPAVYLSAISRWRQFNESF